MFCFTTQVRFVPVRWSSCRCSWEHWCWNSISGIFKNSTLLVRGSHTCISLSYFPQTLSPSSPPHHCHFRKNEGLYPLTRRCKYLNIILLRKLLFLRYIGSEVPCKMRKKKKKNVNNLQNRFIDLIAVVMKVHYYMNNHAQRKAWVLCKILEPLPIINTVQSRYQHTFPHLSIELTCYLLTLLYFYVFIPAFTALILMWFGFAMAVSCGLYPVVCFLCLLFLLCNLLLLPFILLLISAHFQCVYCSDCTRMNVFLNFPIHTI